MESTIYLFYNKKNEAVDTVIELITLAIPSEMIGMSSTPMEHYGFLK